MRTQTTRTIAGRVNADGSIANAGGGGFTVQNTAVGTYNLNFPGQRLIAITGTPASWGAFSIGAITGSGCQVAIGLQSGASASNQAFGFQATVAA